MTHEATLPYSPRWLCMGSECPPSPQLLGLSSLPLLLASEPWSPPAHRHPVLSLPQDICMCSPPPFTLPNCLMMSVTASFGSLLSDSKDFLSSS